MSLKLELVILTSNIDHLKNIIDILKRNQRRKEKNAVGRGEGTASEHSHKLTSLWNIHNLLKKTEHLRRRTFLQNLPKQSVL